MEPLACYPSQWKHAGHLALTALMTNVSFFCTRMDDWGAVIFGWIGVAFFGLGLVVFPREIFRAFSPAVVICEEGIEDYRGGYGLIPWTDIAELLTYSTTGREMISVIVKNQEAYRQRVGRFRRVISDVNESAGYPPITITFGDLKPGLTEVMDYIHDLPCQLSISEGHDDDW